MSDQPIAKPLYTTLEGLKSRAKKHKRQTGCTHTEALEAMAIAGGYMNFSHARNVLWVNAE